MQITLRRAHAVQRSIDEAIASLNKPMVIDMSIYDSVDVIETATDAFLTSLDMRTDLLKAKYEIRNMVAEANFKAGIDELLVQQEAVNELIKMVTLVTKAPLAKTEEAVKAQKQKLLSASDSNYYSDSFSVSLISEDIMRQAKNTLAELKKEKVSIQDKLLEANVANSITLSDSVVETLKTAQLL